ncbi:MAG TPA: ABC transporter permease, partial [Casimicrobiaceae bacterium]|nr:ABC transporter permease [Casimicrobiaceae bacterium]
MSVVADPTATDLPAPPALQTDVGRRLLRNPGVVAGATILAIMLSIALAAPWLGTVDPAAINPSVRNKLPGYEETIRGADGRESTLVHHMGTDTLGRDIYSRVAYGARASLLVGASVALIGVAIGLVIGLVAGYIRWLDGIVMRVMDGLMAIPAILLAIAVVSLSSTGLLAVIV